MPRFPPEASLTRHAMMSVMRRNAVSSMAYFLPPHPAGFGFFSSWLIIGMDHGSLMFGEPHDPHPPGWNDHLRLETRGFWSQRMGDRRVSRPPQGVPGSSMSSTGPVPPSTYSAASRPLSIAEGIPPRASMEKAWWPAMKRPETGVRISATGRSRFFPCPQDQPATASWKRPPRSSKVRGGGHVHHLHRVLQPVCQGGDLPHEGQAEAFLELHVPRRLSRLRAFKTHEGLVGNGDSDDQHRFPRGGQRVIVHAEEAQFQFLPGKPRGDHLPALSRPRAGLPLEARDFPPRWIRRVHSRKLERSTFRESNPRHTWRLEELRGAASIRAMREGWSTHGSTRRGKVFLRSALLTTASAARKAPSSSCTPRARPLLTRIRWTRRPGKMRASWTSCRG